MNMVRIGSLLSFHGKPAIVQDLNKEKIEIKLDKGTVKSVRPKDVEFIHAGPCQILPGDVLPLPDMNEFLELIGEEAFPFAEFCELLYGKYTPESAWSGYLHLREGKYFTGSVDGTVQARSREEIEAALHAAEEKQRAKDEYQALLERIRNHALLPEDRQPMCEIEALARGDTQTCRLLKDLGIEVTDVEAHALLVRLGVWKDTVNPFPDRLKIDMEAPSLSLPEIPHEERTDLTEMVSLAIDNTSSNDPDDAISFADGLLWVHIADPASVVTPGTELDLCASAAGENLYLPDKVISILPEGAVNKFGLGIQEISPAISFGIRVEPDGKPVLEKLVLSKVHVERLTYQTAEPRMNDLPLSEIRAAMDRFRQWRLEHDALLIRLPEVQLHLENDEITIEQCEVTPIREMVANAMLAAGAAVAEFALQKEIPMPFAAQTPVEERLEGDSFSVMYQQRKLCSPGYITTSPEPHAGLGLNQYVRVTSPLRRYTDLLAHQQLRRYLANEELLTSEELEERFSPAEKEGMNRRKAERSSNEYYTLVWLARHPDWCGKAVVVNRINDSTTLLIPELAYEFKSRACAKAAMDEEIEVKLHSVEPAKLLSRFTLVH